MTVAAAMAAAMAVLVVIVAAVRLLRNGHRRGGGCPIARRVDRRIRDRVDATAATAALGAQTERTVVGAEGSARDVTRRAAAVVARDPVQRHDRRRILIVRDGHLDSDGPE